MQEPKPDSQLAEVLKDLEQQSQQAQATVLAAEEKKVIEESTAQIDELQAEKQVRSDGGPAAARRETRQPFASHGQLQSCAICGSNGFNK